MDKQTQDNKTEAAALDSNCDCRNNTEELESKDKSDSLCISRLEYEELQKKSKERDEYLDLLQRKQAEFENYRKRMSREREDFAKYAHADFVMSILPAMDNFKAAMKACREKMDPKGIMEGVDMICRQFEKELQDRGVSRIDAAGGRFDPLVHEILEYVFDDTKEDQTVIDQVRDGYKLHDRLLRPSLVRVSTTKKLHKDNEKKGE